MSEETDLTKLKVVGLKRLCKERGLMTTGSKTDLLARLSQHDDEDAVLTEAIGSTDEVKEEEEELLEDTTEEEMVTGVEEEERDGGKKGGDGEKSKKSLVPIKAPLTTEDVLNQKRAERQKRFGNFSPAATKNGKPEPESERLRKRAERFKTSSSSATTAATKTTTGKSTVTLEMRKKRFGGTTTTTTTTTTPSKDEVDELKAKRAKRFALTA